MALVNSTFNVNVTPGAMPPTVHVSEYDIGRTYTVTINGQNGSAFNIPTGTTATVEGTLNGVIGFTTGATISGSTVSFTLTESMTAKSGKAWCKIKLTLNDEPIQTCAFVLAVDRAGVEAETVIGADGFDTQIRNAVDNYLDEHPVGVEVDPTLTIAGAAADAAAVGNLKSDLNSVFNYGERSATLSALADGYISKTGTIEGTGASTRHASLEITSDYVGKNLKVTGSNWYSMKPYVFVGDNSTIVYADCPSASLSVYTDLPFKPTTTGTLYVNHHTDSATYGVKIHEIDTLKDTALPDDLANALEYVSGYKEMTFATETGHYLNASNGNITDVDSTNAVITEFIPIVGGNPYLITTEHFWGQGMYVFYDVNKSYISGVASANSGTITKVINQKVTAPQNASYLVVAMWAQTNFPDITVCECVFSSISPSLKWNGKKWTCVGDSLTEQNIKAVRHYYDYVSEATGIAPVILGVGGTGYARGQENNNAFYQRVSAVPSDSDVITIFGSFNDLGSNLPIGNVDDVNTTTIAGCINTTINNILTINPIANIGIVAPCPWSTTQPTESGGEYQYVSMIEAICKRRSIPYLDLWHYSGMRPWDSAFSNLAYPPNDTVHPNDVGHSILAPKFKAFLESLLM